MNSMDFRTVSRFIDIIEGCKGNVLISGIGENSVRFRLQ